jgi:phosphatidylglycerol:prolipoprotein diacylglycerol transferase
VLVAPDINPIAVDLGPIKIHWYGLMYVLGFVAVWWLGSRRVKQPGSGWTEAQLSDVIFYGVFGILLGGRLGYVLFYNLPFYLDHPLDILKIWQGGMAFHGALLGVIAALWWVGRKHGKAFFAVTDFVAPWAPIGLGLGRIGNFINQELWGRVTDLPWGMVFRGAGELPRHPSQLYQAALEGVALFAILWLYTRKPRPVGAVSGLFVMCYGLQRFLVEFARQPDAQLGFVLGPFTMGQLLSVPMILAGVAIVYWSYNKSPKH